jgi:hypothetical protein
MPSPTKRLKEPGQEVGQPSPGWSLEWLTKRGKCPCQVKKKEALQKLFRNSSKLNIVTHVPKKIL